MGLPEIKSWSFQDNDISWEMEMKEFYKDIKHWIDYDYVVINDELNKCYEEISKIIDSSYNDIKKIKYDNNLIKEHIKKLTS